jgi:LytS/YehU family sensor histidine kinase
MRFQGRFDYQIKIAPDIVLSEVEIPSMMLQPFLENSIWHGILPTTKHGEITVDIRGEGDTYLVTIDDNGIGVETSMSTKSGNSNGHVSKGMEITQSRIELYKRMTGLGYNIVGPEQITNRSGEILGTRVIIRLPKKSQTAHLENSSFTHVEF